MLVYIWSASVFFGQVSTLKNVYLSKYVNSVQLFSPRYIFFSFPHGSASVISPCERYLELTQAKESSQPRSQGRDERPWERGWKRLPQFKPERLNCFYVKLNR